MEKWHAAKPKSIAKRMPAPAAPKKPQAPAAAVHEGLRRRARARVRARPARRRHHRRDELRHRPVDPPEGACPTATSTSASPSSRPCCSPPASRSQGARPVCAIYSTFLQRAYDQIVHDVCLQSLPVVFCMDRAGLVGDDGPTHHGAFDIAYLRCLPNITLMAPRDEAMLVHMLHTALRHDAGPVAHPLPARRGRRRAAARPAGADRDRHRRDPARGRARRARRLRHAASARRSAPPTSSPRAGSTSPSPTRASPSRSTPGCSPSSPPSTTCS